MTSAPEQTTNEQLFFAVGEFFVTFSHLISITEYLTAALISKDGEEEAYKRARIAVSNLTAKPLSNAFFSVLKGFETQNWTANDHVILKRTRTEMDSLIAQRNRFAHEWPGNPGLFLSAGMLPRLFFGGVSLYLTNVHGAGQLRCALVYWL